VLDLGTVGGRRVRRYVYGRTQREVLLALAELRRDVSSGRDVTAPHRSVSQWLDQWLVVKRNDGVRATTFRFYEQLIEAHIKPDLGEVRLDRLSPGDVRSLISAKMGTHLSPTTVAHILRLLRNALGDAENLDLVPRNAAKAVRMPAVPRREAPTLDVAEARRLLSVISGHRLHALFATALVLGLRRGEVLGLSWDDVDFRSDSVRIKASLQRLNGTLQLVPPKTRASASVLATPPGLMKILSRHRVEQQAERLAIGPAWPGLPLVFTSTTGTALEPRNVNREWEKVRAQAGLPELRFHDLRHSCATLLTALGVHPRVVMEMLRHSEIGVTMNLYSHVSPVLQRGAAEALESALFQ